HHRRPDHTTTHPADAAGSAPGHLPAPAPPWPTRPGHHAGHRTTRRGGNRIRRDHRTRNPDPAQPPHTIPATADRATPLRARRLPHPRPAPHRPVQPGRPPPPPDDLPHRQPGSHPGHAPRTHPPTTRPTPHH